MTKLAESTLTATLFTVAAALNVFVPTTSMDSPWPAKSATPPTAALVSVPDKVPLPVCRFNVIVRVASAPEVTKFPAASKILTTG
jgi:hypothetical protein